VTDFFKNIAKVKYQPDATGLAFRHYDPDEMLLGKRMEDHLRFAVAYWHSFAWPGGDPFGGNTFERPWFGDSMDTDIRPEGNTFAQSQKNFETIIDYLAEKMSTTKTRLLWGTANLFSHRRFMSGAATNPDPEIFAWSAAIVKNCMDATHRLQGENYVLWGGREGYETLLNTDLRRERQQAGRFLQMVVEYKHKIGFTGAILVEPKPQEPSKHQYDYDVATVYGFLKEFGLENEVRVNVEQGHVRLGYRSVP